MNDNLNKIIEQCQNIESILFTTDFSHFQNFIQMQDFLECADTGLTQKIEQLDKKMNIVHDEYIRTSTVYEINNKKRAKQQQLLSIERQKIVNDLQVHKNRLDIQVHPMTLVLKEKQNEIKKLYQTKQIIEDFNKMLKGDEEQIRKIMLLDEKNFSNSALKIYIFKILMEDLNGPQYDVAKNQIRKKFAQLKNKILINFKQAFWKKDIMLMKTSLPYCQEYDLMDEVSQFYNEQAFKQSNKISKLSEQEAGESEIKNFFFHLQRGFQYAFNEVQQNTGQTNICQIYLILGNYSEVISRRLISYVFQNLLKQSIQNVLRSTFSSHLYLTYLDLFYGQCKAMIKTIEQFITDDRIIHLISTYFQSVFDVYLESYLKKQKGFLENSLEENMGEVLQEIKNSNKAISQGLYQQQQQTTKKFSIKKIMDFKIQEKVFNPEVIRIKIKTLLNVFMSSSLQKIFMTIKQSLTRNMKIAKINQVDKNRNQLLGIFIFNLSELLNHLINNIAQVVPGFGEAAATLEPEFFQIIPNINLLLQRMQYVYVENKKQARYQFAQALMLEQKKEQLITTCQKRLNKIVGQALANILQTQNSLLKAYQNEYYVLPQKQKMRNPNETGCSKVMDCIQKYLRPINKINLSSYKTTILKDLGFQFTNLLIKHYSQISYTKQGLGNIFIDIANYKKIVIQIDNQEIDLRYKVLRSLIDIYVIKNQEKTIHNYVKNQKQGVLHAQRQDIIEAYIKNKMRNQKV